MKTLDQVDDCIVHITAVEKNWITLAGISELGAFAIRVVNEPSVYVFTGATVAAIRDNNDCYIYNPEE